MPTTHAKLAPEVRGLIVQNLMFGQGDGSFADEDSLMEKGLIDSTSVLELVQLLEERFSIKLEDEELIPENLDSVRNICRFLESKSGSSALREAAQGGAVCR